MKKLTDEARMDWLEELGNTVLPFQDGWWPFVHGIPVGEFCYHTKREAIDAGIAIAKAKEAKS